jgi:single-strand DNA-binding protein
VHVEGYLRSESWESPTGEKRSKVKVEAERVQFLDRRDDAGAGGPSEAPGTDEDYVPPAREPRRAPTGFGPKGAGNGPGRSAPPPSSRQAAAAEDDEDIPF